jgi:Tfp pilus assembly PilM family ATPase
VTALDVDGLTLWVVQTAQRGSQIAITRADSATLALAPDADRNDPVALGQAIAGALASLKLKPGAVVMGVPRAQLVLRTLTLPVVDDIRELASMVHFQVGKDLPFQAADAVIDFKVHRQIDPPPASAETVKAETGVPAATPRLEILVAAAHRDVVAFCEQTAEAAGIKLAALGLRAYANARCVQACEVVDGDQAVALVSLRPDEVNIDIIVEEALLFSRGAVVKSPTETTEAAAAPPGPGKGAEPSPMPAGSEEPAEDPVSLESFVDAATIEVVRTLHGYGGTAARSPVAKVVVAGASGHEEAVVQALSKRLSIPCSLLDPAKAVGLESDAQDCARGAVAALGLALGVTDPEGLPFDFLDPKKPAVQRDLRRIRLLAGVAAVAALFLVLILVRSQLVQRRMAINRAVQAELTEAEKKRPIYRTMRLQAATVEEWQRGERNWLDHYAFLSAILPSSEEVYITSMNVSPQGAIRLAVQARSGEILAKLDKQLRAAGYEIKPLAITPGADRFGYDFSSTVELTVPDRMALDLAKVRPPARPADDMSLDPGALKGGRP